MWSCSPEVPHDSVLAMTEPSVYTFCTDFNVISDTSDASTRNWRRQCSAFHACALMDGKTKNKNVCFIQWECYDFTSKASSLLIFCVRCKRATTVTATSLWVFLVRATGNHTLGTTFPRYHASAAVNLSIRGAWYRDKITAGLIHLKNHTHKVDQRIETNSASFEAQIHGRCPI